MFRVNQCSNLPRNHTYLLDGLPLIIHSDNWTQSHHTHRPNPYIAYEHSWLTLLIFNIYMVVNLIAFFTTWMSLATCTTSNTRIDITPLSGKYDPSVIAQFAAYHQQYNHCNHRNRCWPYVDGMNCLLADRMSSVCQTTMLIIISNNYLCISVITRAMP